MRNFYILIAGLIIGSFLSGCSGTGTPVSASRQPTSTPPPPQISTQAIVTMTIPPVDATQQVSTSINSPAVEPTGTMATAPTSEKNELTQTPAVDQPKPTQTPAVDQPKPTQTPLPVKPTATKTATQPESAGVQSATPAPAPAGETSAACEDKAAFYADMTVPDNSVFQQSVEFIKTWQIKNAGTCTWEGYSLVFGGGSSMDAPLSTPIPVVRPGDLAEVSVKLKSPNQGGVYTSLWQFQNRDGKRFGVNAGGIDFIWAKIAVSTIPQGSDQAGSQPIPGPVSCQTRPDSGIVNQLLVLINQARTDAGLRPLALQAQLSAAAQGHSEDMACKDYVDHTGSDGSNWYDRIKAQGYPYLYASENIYYGDPDFGGGPQDAFGWWMKSKVHHDNMLSKKVTEIGIGYAYYANSTYKGYYTLNFGKR